MLNLKKPNFPIGIDISDKVLKAIELKKQRDKIKINAISKYRLKPGDIENGEIKNPEAVIDGLKLLLLKPNFGTFNSNEVIVCLPDPKTYIKLIKIAKTPNTLKQVIETEIEKNIPLSIKNIYYDYQKIKETDSYYEVLIGAAPKIIIDEYTDIINQAKLSVVAFEIESIATTRALLEEETKKYHGNFNKNYCIIDIGAKRTSLTIYSKNTIVISLSLPISGDETTELIAKSLEIKQTEAEKAKIICGLDKTQAHGIVSDILNEQIEKINEKIEISIDFFKKHYPGLGNIDEIILCGGGANIRNLDLAIKEKIGIPAQVKSPLANFDTTKKQEELFSKLKTYKNKKNKVDNFEQNTVTSYSTAIGLALRNVYLDNF